MLIISAVIPQIITECCLLILILSMHNTYSFKYFFLTADPEVHPELSFDLCLLSQPFQLQIATLAYRKFSDEFVHTRITFHLIER